MRSHVISSERWYWKKNDEKIPRKVQKSCTSSKLSNFLLLRVFYMICWVTWRVALKLFNDGFFKKGVFTFGLWKRFSKQSKLTTANDVGENFLSLNWIGCHKKENTICTVKIAKFHWSSPLKEISGYIQVRLMRSVQL